MKQLFLCIVTMLLFVKTTSQSIATGDFSYFDSYNNFGFSVAKFSYRNSEFDRSDIAVISADRYKGLQLGFRYHYNKDKPWSFNSGLLFNYMYNSTINFKNEEVNLKDNLKNKFYVQLPISAEVKMRLGYNIYFNFNMGLTFSHMNGSDYISSLNVEDDTATEIFRITYNDGSLIHISSLLESGVYITFNKFMLKVNMIYNKSFDDIWEGEYVIKDLQNTTELHGSFRNVGDYFGVSTTIYLPRKIQK